MSSLARYLDPEVIQQVSRLDLRARFIVEGFVAGLHRSPFLGLSTEFSEHRKYVQGDDLRTIDWNVYARTDRVYVRKYQAETHLDCHLLVDASASMGYVGEVKPPRDAGATASKLDYAIHLAAALGYLVTKQQDAIGLGVLGEGLQTLLPPRSRRADLVQLLATLAAIKPRGRTGLATGIHDALQRIPHRSVIVVLSDLLTDTAQTLEALHHVRFRGHDLIVMHILDVAEVRFPFEGAVRLEDPETGAALEAEAEGVRTRYVEALADWRAELRDRISALRGDYVPLDTSVKFDKALVEFLIQRSRRR
ncbi:MAG: DUF58 domain-containing protein [Phycisphaerae bacterium]